MRVYRLFKASALFLSSSLRPFSTINQPAKLHYLRTQSASQDAKLNLVVAHGQLGSHMNFRSIVKHEPITKYANPILVDLRNHGNSEHKDTMSLGEMANDIANLIQELKLDRVIFMGHSLGGRVAMKFAVNYPDLADGIIISDILPINYSNHPYGFTFPTSMQKLLDHLNKVNLKQNLQCIKNEIKLVEPNDTIINFIMTNLKEKGPNDYEWRCNMKAIAESSFRNMDDKIIQENQERYRGKVQIVAGEKSPYMPPGLFSTFGQVFENYNEKSDTCIIKDAGHWIHFDKPKEFVACVSEFISKF